MGLAALIWFLVRVMPKPSRASYPCQRVGAPIALGGIAYLLSLFGLASAYRQTRKFLHQNRYVVAGVCLVIGLACALVVIGQNEATARAAWTPTDPPNTPMGVARGIHPGRVVWVRDPQAPTWDGNKSNNTYWWDTNGANQAKVDLLVSRSLRVLTGTNTDAAAWDLLFRSFNQRHGRPNRGYQSGEGIAIKINQNTARTDHSMNGNTNGEWNINGNPQLIKSILRQLVNQAGIPQTNITVYDASRYIGDSIYVPNHQEFPSVHFMDFYGGQGREKAVWTSTNVIAYAVNHSLGRQLPVQVVNAAYVINMAIMKNHGDGPTLSGKLHYGSLASNGTSSQGDHNAIFQSGGMNTYASLVDLMGQKHLGEKTVLFMIDTLYAAPGADAVPAKWKMAPFNTSWPASVFVSQDGVASDSVGFDFMNAEWGLAANSDNYLHEAAKANNPGSGTTYAPNGDGVRLSSLGVHEHWNNATNKQYSRNLSPNGTGIELVTVPQSAFGLSVGITNPANGAVITVGTDVTLQASVTATYSTICKVDFFRGATLLGTVTNSPFNLVWTNPPAGAWTLSATVTDSDNFAASSPSVNITVQTNVWSSGGSFTVNVSDATGPAGTGYTQTNYTGFLDVQAVSTNPFRIQLGSLNGGSAGLAANFNNNSNDTWTIATTTRGVLEFDPAKFIVDPGAFSNDLAGGTFSVATNGNAVNLVFTPNHPPVAFPLFLNRAWDTVMRISIVFVLTNSTTDPDGDPTALSGVGASTNGTPITTNSSYIFFTPTNNLPESFTYTIHDVRSYRPGDTVRTATGWITISVTNAIGSVVSVASSGGAITIQFAGVPGYAYDVERTTNLGGPWTVVQTTNAPPHGLWLYTDSDPPQPSAFYRLRQH